MAILGVRLTESSLEWGGHYIEVLLYVISVECHIL